MSGVWQIGDLRLPYDNLFSLRLETTRMLCSRVPVKKRLHRRSRINKKWIKRYGLPTRCQYVAYRVYDTLYCCPCVKAKIDRVTKELSNIEENLKKDLYELPLVIPPRVATFTTS